MADANQQPSNSNDQPQATQSGLSASSDPAAEQHYQANLAAARARLEQIEAAIAGGTVPAPVPQPRMNDVRPAPQRPATQTSPPPVTPIPQPSTQPTVFTLSSLKNPTAPVQPISASQPQPAPPQPVAAPQVAPQPAAPQQPMPQAAPPAPAPAPAPLPEPDVAAMMRAHKSVSPLSDAATATSPPKATGAAIPEPSKAPVDELRPKRRAMPSRLKPLLSAVIIFFVVMGLFKAPIFYYQLKYMFANQNAATNSTTTSTGASTIASSTPTLTIPKINVTTPIVFEPSIVEANVQKALESGVVHYGNTAAPGEVGNTVIFGHSSNDWDKPGNYKFIFVLLEKLTVGDTFSIDYKGTRYEYQITDKQVILPTDVGVVAPTPTAMATLITCWPVGTSQKRLIVKAKQISPTPKTSDAKTETALKTQNATALPGTASNTGVSGTFNTWVDAVWSALKGEPVTIN